MKIKLVFAFANGYLRNLKLSRTYQQPIEQQKLICRRKNLGVVWIVQEDKFSFCFSPPPEKFPLTKRNVLKKTATIYDPFGFLTPYIVPAKMLMQEGWMEALGWDGELPHQLKADWKKWFEELG